MAGVSKWVTLLAFIHSAPLSSLQSAPHLIGIKRLQSIVPPARSGGSIRRSSAPPT
jgi:hypothetical protein